MEAPFELFVALRYLRARRKQAFISVISLISGIGVAVGVMALLITLALMTGLQSELRDRIIGSSAHIYVYKIRGLGDPAQEVQKLRTVPGVEGAAPIVLGAGLATSAGASEFLTLKGIDPALEGTVTNASRAMQAGSLDALTPAAASSMATIVLGKDLAQKLTVQVGDTIEVMTSEGPLTPFGVAMGRRAFKVVGIFNLGLYEYDAGYGFVHLTVAQSLLRKPHPDFIELRVKDLFRARQIADSISSVVGSEYVAQDWSDMNKSLFSALWLEKMAMSITIGLIVMVAALNIIATMILLVMEKTRDIAILKTMGSSAATIRRVFLLQGLVIGLIGTLVGAVGGGSMIFLLDHYKLIKISTEVYQISYVPFRLQPLDFVVVVVAAVLICFLATVYPSRQAAKLDPAQALRYQ
jgi:lipoprotein-releasing system permease protein